MKSSTNPSYNNILRLLDEFDNGWKNKFKDEIGKHIDKDKMQTGINSLVENRNNFAHGGNPIASINETYSNFIEARKMIEVLDDIIS